MIYLILVLAPGETKRTNESYNFLYAALLKLEKTFLLKVKYDIKYFLKRRDLKIKNSFYNFSSN